jgi:hypothetical protein
MSDSLEFECSDCDHRVVSIAPPHSPGRRCAGCHLLAGMENLTHREELRTWMAERGVIGTPHQRFAPRPVAAYHDERCPPRACDNCGRL